MVKKYFFIGFIGLVLTFSSLFSIRVIAAPESTSNASQYKNNAFNLINQDRTSKGLKPIVVDENLCKVAALVAEDLETAYPNKINTDLFSSPKYALYMKNYSFYTSSVLTMNDVLVKVYKERNIPIPSFADQDIADQVTSSLSTAPQNSLINGCIAQSSGKSGYKPYIYFVGAIKKSITPTPSIINNQPIQNNSQGLLETIKSAIKSLLKILHL